MCFFGGLSIFLLVSCVTAQPLPTSTPVPTQIPLPPATIAPTRVVLDTGWSFVQPGLEQRRVSLLDNGVPQDEYLIARIDLGYLRFEIHYDSTNPKDLQTWAYETGAQVVMNGGYFDVANEQYLPTGLLIIDGQTYGESLGDYAGMFVVDGNFGRLLWLRTEPYRNEPHQFALQSFPMLVKPGGELGLSFENEDNLRARRTVIAQDRGGRFVLFASAYSYFTLHQLSKYLVNSDLDLDVAVNLDGGPSTGLLISGSGAAIPAVSNLPIVITVHAR